MKWTIRISKTFVMMSFIFQIQSVGFCSEKPIYQWIRPIQIVDPESGTIQYSGIFRGGQDVVSLETFSMSSPILTLWEDAQLGQNQAVAIEALVNEQLAFGNSLGSINKFAYIGKSKNAGDNYLIVRENNSNTIVLNISTSLNLGAQYEIVKSIYFDSFNSVYIAANDQQLKRGHIFQISQDGTDWKEVVNSDNLIADFCLGKEDCIYWVGYPAQPGDGHGISILQKNIKGELCTLMETYPNKIEIFKASIQDNCLYWVERISDQERAIKAFNIDTRRCEDLTVKDDYFKEWLLILKDLYAVDNSSNDKVKLFVGTGYTRDWNCNLFFMMELEKPDNNWLIRWIW